jgi:hypothetical protein
MSASALQSITDDLLIDAINRATQRVVMIGPGVWPPLANSIAQAWHRLGAKNVTVILDVDAEICRMGYGSLEGLEILQSAAVAAGEVLGGEPGVRICVVIADDQTFVFSPTPRQLEAPPGLSPAATTPQPKSQPKANGIVLANPPAALETELGGGPEGDTSRTLGLDFLDQAKLDATRRDLADNPPKQFDLSQAVSVYNAKIQFVEFTVTGCRLSEQRARLPKHLLHVLKNNPKLAGKIENSIRLLDENDELLKDPNLSQETIGQHRAQISQDFLLMVVNIGTIIERSRKTEFLACVKTLQGEVKAFGELVEKKLSERFQATAKELADELLPEVLKDVPKAWRKWLGDYPDPEQVRWRIVDDLRQAFGDPAAKVRRMKVETVFKDVTYEMLQAPDFRVQLAPHFPDLPLMEEYTAAKERQSDETSLFSEPTRR